MSTKIVAPRFSTDMEFVPTVTRMEPRQPRRYEESPILILVHSKSMRKMTFIMVGIAIVAIVGIVIIAAGIEIEGKPVRRFTS